MSEEKNIIIYHTPDGKASVSLLTREGTVWMNQNQLAELFDTSVPNISMHITTILKEGELDANSGIKDYLSTGGNGRQNSVVKHYLTTAADGKNIVSWLQNAVI